MTDITRAVAIRRGLRNLDLNDTACHDADANAIELELARAYDAGHIAGSGVKHQTEAEVDLCNAVRELTHYEVVVIGEHVSPLLRQLIDDVRHEKRDTEPCPPPSHLPGVSLDGL
jgi:hypothetical protein